ncbi:MAG TPA: hypothetical protein VMH86_00030 [Rhizomicrobium sp.]|nr:hypothetical protein [Rhizomicrobium sp.]
MAIFDVKGPFEVPTMKLDTGIRAIDEDRAKIRKFWENTEIGDRHGCYVFAVWASRGYMPIYVGRATSSRFDIEVLNDRNIKNCNLTLAGRRRGTLWVFLLPIRKTRGKINANHISLVEEYLVGHAARKNKNLINTHLLPSNPWSITGLINSGQGQPPIGAQELKRALGI